MAYKLKYLSDIAYNFQLYYCWNNYSGNPLENGTAADTTLLPQRKEDITFKGGFQGAKLKHQVVYYLLYFSSNFRYCKKKQKKKNRKEHEQ